jgi:hypothetical protein
MAIPTGFFKVLRIYAGRLDFRQSRLNPDNQNGEEKETKAASRQRNHTDGLDGTRHHPNFYAGHFARSTHSGGALPQGSDGAVKHAGFRPKLSLSNGRGKPLEQG